MNLTPLGLITLNVKVLQVYVFFCLLFMLYFKIELKYSHPGIRQINIKYLRQEQSVFNVIIIND